MPRYQGTAQLEEQVYWQGTVSGDERLQHVTKTACCGAKVYRSLIRQLGICPICDRPIKEG